MYNFIEYNLTMKNIIVFLLIPVFSFSQKNYSAELDRYMQAQNNVKGFSGVVRIAKENKVLLKYNYGVAKDSIDLLLTLVEKTSHDSLELRDTIENHPRISKKGTVAGYTYIMTKFPDDKLTIVLLSNHDRILSNRLPMSSMIADGLAAIFYDKQVEVPYVHKEVAIDPSLLDKFVGKYKAFLVLEVIKKDGKLWRHREGGPDIELKPESDRKFFYADGSNRQLDFELDSSGKVTKIWFVNNEQRGEMMRQ